MAPSTGDDRQLDAVQREMQRRKAQGEPDDPDLVETVGEEQRRQRAALDDDAAEDED
ncbi:MAG TPA: hypothetical protein VHF51_04430 [Solirubrobacteraceae bacterium]|jgi:hypothetical protein|nr:hypothetical protein [Solirubrobacteraceae bacterium]